MVSKFASGIALLSLVFAAGCAIAPPGAGDIAVNDDVRSGRLSITTYRQDRSTVQDRQTGNFQLVGTREGTREPARPTKITKSVFTVSSPFGQTIATITLKADTAEILTVDGKRFTATGPQADQLVCQEALGWPLPLNSLSDLLLSNAADAPKLEKVLPNNWRAEVLEYVANKPKRIRLDWNNEASNESERSITSQSQTPSAEIGRIAVLIVINE